MTAPAAHPPRIFLLSPAHCGGERARLVFDDQARFDLARRLRSPEGATLADAFTFMSGLYFRGKIAYALHFQRPPAGLPGVLVVTPSEGLRRHDERVDLPRLGRFAQVDIAKDDPRYRRPMLRDANALAEHLDPACEIVLLGSVATGKYVDVLTMVFGSRLLFPSAFVGRGDMSRGGLLLRCVRDDRELDYVPVLGAVRHGPRPPRLAPVRWK
ncbi:MAG TPA: hypothetical protein VMT87_14130 [Vicinamibacteria bacterium]|nr:hypothetical protein [Vicinamibacteria bacterium]